jgi:2-methylisocitrate lyase-like PEP mutase family enzyme
MAWGMGGWLLFPFLQKIGPEAVQALRERVAAELKTTFASHYTKEISLAEALQLEAIAVYGQRATGTKFLIFAPDAAGVAENVRLAVATGVAGLSIEDSTGDAARPLFTLDEAVKRIRAARGAIDQSGGGVMLVGRAECFLVGRPDLAETLARLQAYANAGADCLYAPGVTTREQIVALVEAVAPKPLNLLVGSASELTVADIAALGVRRISVGGALARSAWGGFMRSARVLAEQGRFDGFADAASGKDLNALFSKPGAGSL